MEVDNLNIKNDTSGKLNFLRKKGFYVVLLLSIVITSAAAIIVTTNRIISTTDFDSNKMLAEDENKSPGKEDSSSITSESEKSTGAFKGQESSDKKDDNKTEEPKDVIKNNSDATDQDKTKEALKQPFIAPVKGELIREFASNTLVYSKTFDDWRTHKGIDISSPRGTLVKAALDGVVSEVKNDPNFGITVIIEHSNNIKTVYSNLASDDMVLTNQKIKQGEAIGCIGNTAKNEILDNEHLHFEVLVKNQSVDPRDYISENMFKN